MTCSRHRAFDLIARRLRYRSFDLAFGNVLVMDGDRVPVGREARHVRPAASLSGEFRCRQSMVASRRLGAVAGAPELSGHHQQHGLPQNAVSKGSAASQIFATFTIGILLCARRWWEQVEYLPHALTTYRVHASNTIKEDSSRVDAEVRTMLDQTGARLSSASHRTKRSQRAWQLTRI